MKNTGKIFSSLTLLLTFCTQKPTAESILAAHKAQLGDLHSIQNIIALAKCEGPEGNYTTRTTSDFTSDYLLFQQEYAYKDNPFYAVIFSKEIGYGLDTTLSSQGALSDAVIAILKAHEFHELAMQADNRYFKMEVGADTVYFGVDCRQIKAVDHLGYPVRLFFNVHTKLMEGFSQVNPYQKEEVIQIHFTNWQEENRLHLFKNLEILQGKKQPYLFEYHAVRINDPTFTKLSIP